MAQANSFQCLLWRRRNVFTKPFAYLFRRNILLYIHSETDRSGRALYHRERSGFIAKNEIIYYIGVIAYGILGFFVKRLIADFDRLKGEVNDLRDHLEQENANIRDNYLKYEEFVRFQTSIDMKLTKIYEILVER